MRRILFKIIFFFVLWLAALIFIGPSASFWIFTAMGFAFICLVILIKREEDRFHSAEKEVMDHIMEKFPKDYKELRIGVARSEFDTVLIGRLNRGSKFIPHDEFLDMRYPTLLDHKKKVIRLGIALGLLAIAAICISFFFKFMTAN
jgi:hypothetical protein